ncbi:helix-turn-helix domain-containing protein [Conservatibacter flavescens]|uniref:Transcriptional regulator n=1 Tax=Conservatibacter flavescens TaxID=28161 RepID=A0A2M8S3C6_9PAST|nr:helix-turn-helix transcriptional regulator [Conservatibacter flavescens]PJG85662.1 transcriptional regulator [Conservatibacter flavescens]
MRKRVSAKHLTTDVTARHQVRADILGQLFSQNITQGQALRLLRLRLLGFTQERFAQVTHISRKTLSDLENDRGNYSVDIVNQAFKPFGLKLTIAPVDLMLMKQILENK